MFYKKRFHFNDKYGYGYITYTSKDGQETISKPEYSEDEIRAITIKENSLRMNTVNLDTGIRLVVEIPLSLLSSITIIREKDFVAREIYDETN